MLRSPKNRKTPLINTGYKGSQVAFKPIPDMALHLRCSKCGGRQIKVMINVKELYAKAYGAGKVGK